MRLNLFSVCACFELKMNAYMKYPNISDFLTILTGKGNIYTLFFSDFLNKFALNLGITAKYPCKR